MFNFSGSSKKSKIVDKVWLNRNAKWNACAGMLQLSDQCIFVAWFEESFRELQTHLHLSEDDERLLRADDVEPDKLNGKLIVFIEHHPLVKTEEAIFTALSVSEVPVLSSLDEPLFQLFGGDRLVDLVHKLGMKEDDVIGHAMVTKAIRRAQEKIGEKVVNEREASSQQDWFARNYDL